MAIIDKLFLGVPELVDASALGDATLPVGECSCLPHIRVARPLCILDGGLSGC